MEFSIVAIASVLAIALLVWSAVVDAKTQRIPNALVLALVGVWAIAWTVVLIVRVLSGLSILDALSLPLFHASFFNAVFSALVFGLMLIAVSSVYEKRTKKFSIGGGDIKLLAALALFLGFAHECILILAACVLFVVLGLLRKQSVMPFGPVICAVAIILLLL